MTLSPIRLLLIEDNPGDVRLVRELLAQAGPLELHHTDRLQAGLDHLVSKEVDVLLLDLELPDSKGLDTLRTVKNQVPRLPIVVLTGHEDLDSGPDALREGAQDYLSKNQLSGGALLRAIRYAIDRNWALAKLENVNQVLRAIREVSQLLMRERDPRRLIEQICEHLVQRCGFQAAWITLVTQGAPPWAMASAGFDESCAPPGKELTARPWPDCCERALADPAGLAFLSSDCECQGCSQRPAHKKLGRAVAALRDGDTQFGFLGIVLGENAVFHPELLRQVADDVAVALHTHDAEEGRRESEERFRVSFDKAAVGQALGSREGKFLQVNRALADLLKFAPKELEGRTIIEVTHPDDVQLSVDTLSKLSTGQATVRFETRFLRKDWVPLWVDVSAALLPDSGSRPERFIATIVDVTGRKRAEQEHQRALESLRSSEERFRALVENLDDVVFFLDSQGRLVYVSSSVSRYGYLPADLLGHELLEFIHADDVTSWRAAFEATLAGHIAPHEFKIVDKTGHQRFVRSSHRLMKVAGETVGVTGVLIDLTAQRTIEEQLRTAQKMEAVGRLAGGVAHDFNNVLSVIMNYAAFVLDGMHEGDRYRDELEEISKASARAASLTRQLLAFSRKQLLQPEVLNLNSVIADLKKMLRRLIGEDIDLEFKATERLWAVKADRGQIEQVIMNLAVNARDAMPDGGKLTIETANVELDEAFVHRNIDAKAGPHVLLSITDTGHGMDKNTIARLFEPFFTTKGRGKGTGLGLATTYGIIKQSEGSIWVTSEIGKGTTFKIYLPRASEVAGSKPVIRKATRPMMGTETVLVVEDDEEVRNVSRRILSVFGYKVLTAASGSEALLLCEKEEPVHVLLTDLVMPGMNGSELADRMTRRFPNIKVIFTSGYTDDVISNQGIAAPWVTFIAKPFTAADLTTRIREALDGPAVIDTGGGATTVETPLAPSPGETDLTVAGETLPEPLLVSLREAAVAARLDRVLKLVDRIADMSPDLAARLRLRVAEFDYDGIVALVQRGDVQ